MTNLPVPIVVLDLDRRVRMCNTAFEQLFGYSMLDILGVKLESFLAPSDRVGEIVQSIQRAANGDSIRLKTKRRRRDGSLIDVQTFGAPLILNGETIGSFGMYEDLSSQRIAEDAQHQAEEKFRSLFENAMEGIFQTTPEGRYLSVNPALARMYGYSSPAELTEKVDDIARLLYVDPQRREEFKREIEQRGAVHGFEYQIRRKDGTKIWLSENARAVRDADGVVSCYEGTVEDVTERKRSELERQAATEIIRAISLSDNLDDLLRSIHAALKKVLYAENCFVALREPLTGAFQFPFFVDQYDSAAPSSSKVPEKLRCVCASHRARNADSTGRLRLACSTR